MDPESLMIVGVSQRLMSWGYVVAKNSIESGFKGRVYFVNPSIGSLFGVKVFPRVKDVPSPVDLAVLILPADLTPSALEDCASIGVKVAVVISSGFSEAGEQGKKLEDEVVKVARRNNVRVLGPNCNGVYNVDAGLNVSWISKRIITPRPIAFISQSGFLAYSLSYWGKTRGLGFGKFVSVGNQCDINVTELLEYFGQDPAVKAIMLYVEGVKEGRRFMETAKRVSLVKPVIALKAGLEEAGARASLAHTGALTGSKRVYEAAFKQAGVIQASKPENLLVLAAALSSMPRLKGPNIGVVTMGGGWGVISTDELTSRGLKVPELPQQLKERLKQILKKPRVSVLNPVDIGPAWPLEFKTIVEAVNLLIASEAVDGVLTHSLTLTDHAKSIGINEGHPRFESVKEWEALTAMLNLMNVYGKPIAFVTPLSREQCETVKRLEDDGWVVLHSVDEAVTVLKGMLDYHYALTRLKQRLTRSGPS